MRFFRWFGSNESSEAPPEFAQVDLFLRKWNEFATGKIDPGYRLGDHEEEFEHNLTELFSTHAPHAVSRFVFYLVVQYGAYVAASSPLGRAFGHLAQGQCKVTCEDGVESYFTGDVCVWWLDHGSAFPRYPLLEDRLRRRSFRKTLIPMFRRMAAGED